MCHFHRKRYIHSEFPYYYWGSRQGKLGHRQQQNEYSRTEPAVGKRKSKPKWLLVKTADYAKPRHFEVILKAMIPSLHSP